LCKSSERDDDGYFFTMQLPEHRFGSRLSIKEEIVWELEPTLLGDFEKCHPYI
jgi:hypothetical protein